jgi:transposase
MRELREDERTELERFIRRGKANARNITRAQLLLKSGEGWRIVRLAETFGVSQATVSNVRKGYREGGVAQVLKDKVQKNRRRALSGAEEAVLVANACSPVPAGHDHWTLRMLRDKLVGVKVVEGISASTIHDQLKK